MSSPFDHQVAELSTYSAGNATSLYDTGFARAVADGGVDEAGPAIEYRVQHPSGITIRDFICRGRAAKIHDSESEHSCR